MNSEVEEVNEDSLALVLEFVHDPRDICAVLQASKRCRFVAQSRGITTIVIDASQFPKLKDLTFTRERLFPWLHGFRLLQRLAIHGAEFVDRPM